MLEQITSLENGRTDEDLRFQLECIKHFKENLEKSIKMKRFLDNPKADQPYILGVGGLPLFFKAANARSAVGQLYCALNRDLMDEAEHLKTLGIDPRAIIEQVEANNAPATLHHTMEIRGTR